MEGLRGQSKVMAGLLEDAATQSTSHAAAKLRDTMDKKAALQEQLAGLLQEMDSLSGRLADKDNTVSALQRRVSGLMRELDSLAAPAPAAAAPSVSEAPLPATEIARRDADLVAEIMGTCCMRLLVCSCDIMVAGLAIAAATARVVEVSKDGGEAAKEQVKAWGTRFMVRCALLWKVVGDTPVQARMGEAVEDASTNLRHLATSVVRAHSAPRRPEDVPLEQRQEGALSVRDEVPRRGEHQPLWKRKGE